MGSYLDYSCPDCGFRARIGGPEEFFVEKGGSRKRHGHPEAESDEASARGVDGFWMMLWCNGCGTDKRIVTMEFEEPCTPLDAWAGRGIARPGYPADGDRCPDCGTQLLDELPEDDPLCPACRKSPVICTKASD